MRKTLRILLLIFLICIFLFSASVVIVQKFQDRENQQARQEAQQIVEHPSAVPSPEPAIEQIPQPAPEPEPVNEPIPEPEPEPEVPFSDEHTEELLELDLTELQAMNEDVIGWIEIPDTPISYPILQGTDNQYYLNHTWKKEYNAGGSIFMESQNRRDFNNFNTLLYGHRMNNSSMFNSLRHYADAEYAAAHPYVYIVTGEGVRVYEVFAALEVTVTDPIYWLITDQEKYKAPMIEFCMEGSVIESDRTPTEADTFLTLSTCTSLAVSDDRWVVVAAEIARLEQRK